MSRKTLLDLIRKPLGIALLILIVASVWIGVWLHREQPLVESRIFMAVDTLNLNRDLVLTDLSPKTIEVRLTGPSRAMQPLTNQRLTYPLDLTAVSSGTHRLKIDSRLIPLPKNASVLAVSPSVISVVVEKTLERTVPVSEVLRGTPPPGWVLAQVRLTPEKVKIKGPPSQVADLSEVKTKPIELGGVTGSIRKAAALDLPGGISPAVAVDFTVEIEVVKRIVTRRYADVPVEGKNGKHAYTISPGTITIEVMGPVNDLEAMSRTKGPPVYVELEGLEPGVYVRRAVIKLPMDTTLVKAAPEVFTVTVKSKH